MNVMLTCAGRRNYLIKFFQEALKERGRVFAGDASADAAALQEADEGFVLPPVNQIDYFDVLLDLCQRHRIRLLLPLNDLELPLLARQRDRFLQVGTLAVISSPKAIDTCYDKWATFEFLESYGIPAPKTYLSLAEARQALARGEIAFPLVVKPRWGSASIGIEYPEDDEELEIAYRFVKKLLARTFLAHVSASDPERCVLIQERLSGQEYGLDVINDLKGFYITTFVKRKLAMRAGETDRAVTVENDELKKLGEKIGQKLGHVGNLDCDVIVRQKGYCVLEMNPRFGGGYPFSHLAGANLPAALIAWANGEKPDLLWLRVKENIISSKCDRLVTIHR
jgi:carbamoyl-phosphate synthase large subunit